MFKLSDVTGKLLAEREGRRVLQVRPANLDDVGEFGSFRVECCGQLQNCRQNRIHDADTGGDMHCRGKNIVRGLPEIDLVVGVNQALAASLAAEQFRGTVGQYLVNVHIGLRAGAGLPNRQRKLVGMLAAAHFIGGSDDRLRFRGRQQAKFLIDLGATRLDQRQGADQLNRHAFGRDREVGQRALGLGAPKAIRRDFDGAERVLFQPRHGFGQYHLSRR